MTFSGLDFAKALQAGKPLGAPPPWVTHMRVIEENPIESVEEGRIVTNWTPGPHFTMQDGFVQGGLIGAMADGGQGLAVISTHKEFEVWVTVDLHIRFVRPIMGGTTVRLEHQVISKTKTTALAETTFTLPEGKLAAKVTGSWRKLDGDRRQLR
jgi:uncharacterized protein (TIGR00369 family)